MIDCRGIFACGHVVFFGYGPNNIFFPAAVVERPPLLSAVRKTSRNSYCPDGIQAVCILYDAEQFIF